MRTPTPASSGRLDLLLFSDRVLEAQRKGKSKQGAQVGEVCLPGRFAREKKWPDLCQCMAEAGIWLAGLGTWKEQGGITGGRGF